MSKVILLSILIFLSGISAFLLSNTLKSKTIPEAFLYNSVFYFVIAMVICAIFCYRGDITKDTLNISKDEGMCYTYCAITYIVIGLLTSYLYKQYSVSDIAPYKNSLAPLLQFIIGFLIFKDKPTPYKIMGGLLMVIGIYVFSLN
jgi:drug/metabolite transporter (DMT)-like permease